jgi:hypothetical protein
VTAYDAPVNNNTICVAGGVPPITVIVPPLTLLTTKPIESDVARFIISVPEAELFADGIVHPCTVIVGEPFTVTEVVNGALTAATVAVALIDIKYFPACWMTIFGELNVTPLLNTCVGVTVRLLPEVKTVVPAARYPVKYGVEDVKNDPVLVTLALSFVNKFPVVMSRKTIFPVLILLNCLYINYENNHWRNRKVIFLCCYLNKGGSVE